jgi:hypothetical protein
LTTTTPTRYGAPVQLELAFSAGRDLRGAIADFMARMTDGLADGTLDDYRERSLWLLREFGEGTDIAAIDYDAIVAVVDRCRGTLKNTTMKKRLTFLVAVLKLAKKRKRLGELPDLPRLVDDSEPGHKLHTVADWNVMRTFLPSGPWRRLYDLAFWTGHHNIDLFSMQRWMLDLEREIQDEAGNVIARGAFWRRNKKVRKCKPIFVNMQPELAMACREWIDEVPSNPKALVVGKLWNTRRTLHMAADRAVAAGHENITRISLRDLRRSFASMLTGRGYPGEYVRIMLGHEGANSRAQGGESTRPSIATRHYFRATPALISLGVPRG